MCFKGVTGVRELRGDVLVVSVIEVDVFCRGCDWSGFDVSDVSGCE
jgi:hypothetical protein